MEIAENYAALMDKLGYTFQNPRLLENALTHSSFANERKARECKSNERLEFLGDSVLGMVTAVHLFQKAGPLPSSLGSLLLQFSVPS